MSSGDGWPSWPPEPWCGTRYSRSGRRHRRGSVRKTESCGRNTIPGPTRRCWLPVLVKNSSMLMASRCLLKVDSPAPGHHCQRAAGEDQDELRLPGHDRGIPARRDSHLSSSAGVFVAVIESICGHVQFAEALRGHIERLALIVELGNGAFRFHFSHVCGWVAEKTVKTDFLIISKSSALSIHHLRC